MAESSVDVIGGPIFWVLLTVIDLYTWVVLIGVVLSWLIHFNIINTSNRLIYMVGDFTYRATEPVLRPIRNFLPGLGGIDISPVVLIIGLMFVKKVLINIYMGM